MSNNTRPRSQSVGGGERSRQYNPNTAPPEMAMQYIPPPPPFPFTSHPTGPYPDPLDDFLRSLTAADDTQPLPPQHHYPQPHIDEPGPSSMAPHHQQLDPIALAWLQLLQSQGLAQHDPGVGGSGKAQTDDQEHPRQPPAQPTQLPNTPEEEGDSETERTATAEDKRRRNTAASARFRNKKKQWLLNMERTVTSLSRQVDDLEREAADLRRENGWLKEIVMLRTRRLTGGGPVNSSGSSGDQKDTGQPASGKGKQRQ